MDQDMTAEMADAEARGLEWYPRWQVTTPIAGLACLWIDHPALQFAALSLIGAAYLVAWQHRA